MGTHALEPLLKGVTLLALLLLAADLCPERPAKHMKGVSDCVYISKFPYSDACAHLRFSSTLSTGAAGGGLSSVGFLPSRTGT